MIGMLYFDHDTGASGDDKINALRVMHGGAAVDAYWFLVERIYREERPLCIRNAGVMHGFAHSLCTDLDTLSAWIDGMAQLELLSEDGDGNIMSKRAEGHIEAFRSKSRNASQAAKTRWEKANAEGSESKRNASAKRPQSQEKKRKEKVGSAPKGSTTKPGVSDGAAAADAAPTSTPPPRCPECGGLTKIDVAGGFWRCRNPKCNATLKPREIGGAS